MFHLKYPMLSQLQEKTVETITLAAVLAVGELDDFGERHSKTLLRLHLKATFRDPESPTIQGIIWGQTHGRINPGCPFQTMVKTLMVDSDATTADNETNMWLVCHFSRRKCKL